MFPLQSLTTISTDDLPLLAGVCAAYAVYRYVVSNTVLRRIGEIAQVKFLNKFIYRSFDLLHYGFSAAMGLIAICTRPHGQCFAWARECQQMFDVSPSGFQCTLLEKLYFMEFAAYYLVDFFYLFTASEFVLLLFHHIVTLSLITLGTVNSVPALCLSVMILHDVVDFPLYLGKVALYLGMMRTKDIAFVFFASMCIWFRDINLPIMINEALHNGLQNDQIQNKYLYWAMIGLLFCLQACHFIWTAKIFGVLKGIVHGKAIRDSRSE